MCYCIWPLSRHMFVTFMLCLTLNPAVGGGVGCIRGAPLWVSNSGSQRSLSEHPHFAGALDSQVPSRRNTLEDLVLSGLLSKLGSGNHWSQTTPLQRDSRGSPQPGGGKLDGALRSQDERTAQGHCPWPPVQRGGGGEGVPCPLRL